MARKAALLPWRSRSLLKITWFVFTLLGVLMWGEGVCFHLCLLFFFFRNDLVTVFCFQSSEVMRLILVEVNIPLRSKTFTCVFTHSLYHFRHLSVMLCLQPDPFKPILYLKLVMDLMCGERLSESCWIQWKLPSETGQKNWALTFCLDPVLTPKLYSLDFILCEFSKTVKIPL